MKNFVKEFKAFAMKGNVMDLAVAVVIGAAFGKIVSSLVENIVIVGTNGFVVLTDGKMEISYPRDTFDENGLFTNPKNKEKIAFSFQITGKNSLKNSMNYFLNHLRNSQLFELNDFDTSVYSNKITLEMEKDL